MSIVRRPKLLSHRAEEVSQILSLKDAYAIDFGRIGLFISLLGWDRVRQAAEYTANRPNRIKISQPWWYTVGVINQNSARASYLYTLFHWVEMALRASLDCALSEGFGAEWHKLDPPIYLDRTGLGRLRKDYTGWLARQNARGYTVGEEKPQTLWRQDPVTTTYIPDYDSPEDFLASLDFQTVTEMVLHAYSAQPPVRPIVVSPNGKRLSYRTASDEFRWMRTFVRNVIMHNRADALSGAVFEWEAFVDTASRMEKMLVALRYNTADALARHEDKRFVVVDHAVKRMGQPDLMTVLTAVRSGR